MNRRDFWKILMAVVGAGGIDASKFVPATAAQDGQATADVAKIYQLQAAFHRAKTAQDIGLMMSLFDANATLRVQADTRSPYVGADQLRAYWLSSGSFKNRRFSLVPSYKTRIAVRDTEATLYFECHDVADYDKPTRNIINDTFLAGTLRNVGGNWVFYDVTAGPSTPLSLDHYYA